MPALPKLQTGATAGRLATLVSNRHVRATAWSEVTAWEERGAVRRTASLAAVGWLAIVIALPAAVPAEAQPRPGLNAGSAGAGDLGGTGETGPPSRPLPRPSLPEPSALLPDASRALADDLVWSGDLTALPEAVDARVLAEGVRTFQRRTGRPPTGALAPAERAALAAEAARVRAAERLTLEFDPRTGARVPIAGFLQRRGDNPQGGTRWQSADETVTLDTRAPPPEPGGLPALMARLSDSRAPGRVILDRRIGPNGLSLRGETPSGRFWIRYGLGPDGTLRGVSFAYDKALGPRLDRLAAALLHGFSAFPVPEASPSGARVTVAATDGAGPAGGAVSAAARAITAVRVGDGVGAVALAALRACPRPSHEGRGVNVLARDASARLALVTWPVDRSRERALRPAEGGAGPAVVVAPVLDERARGLSAAPAEFVPSPGGGFRVRAALPVGGAGALVLDRSGGFLGLLADDAPPTRAATGLPLARRHVLIPAAAVQAFAAAQRGAALGEARFTTAASTAPASGAPMLLAAEESLASLAGRFHGDVLALDCGASR